MSIKWFVILVTAVLVGLPFLGNLLEWIKYGRETDEQRKRSLEHERENRERIFTGLEPEQDIFND